MTLNVAVVDHILLSINMGYKQESTCVPKWKTHATKQSNSLELLMPRMVGRVIVCVYRLKESALFYSWPVPIPEKWWFAYDDIWVWCKVNYPVLFDRIERHVSTPKPMFQLEAYKPQAETI